VTTVNAAGAILPSLISASYGPQSDVTLRYTAASCVVAAANSVISCLTAPGVGKDLVWQVSVYGQASARLTTDLTSYAPPTTATFTGPGSDQALTQGYQQVVIAGACNLSGVYWRSSSSSRTAAGINFGPDGTPIDVATYGPGNGTEFTSPGCVLTVPHKEVVCNTSVGAGAGLNWFITIAGGCCARLAC